MRDYFAAHYVTVARFGRVAIERPISPLVSAPPRAP